jgi:hypothetical protein
MVWYHPPPARVRIRSPLCYNPRMGPDTTLPPCIFCGAPADSKEDLFPRWTLKRVNTRELLTRQIGDGPRVVTEDQEVRIRCACKKCNGGWMSGMEKTVQRFMGAMLEDMYVPLDRQQQQSLAEWAVKCAMCCDALEGGRPRFFTDEECYTFKKTRKIPDRTLVFVARFFRNSLDANGVDFTLVDPRTKSTFMRGLVQNMMIGHIVLQVLTGHPEPGFEYKEIRGRVANGPWDRLTINVWPFDKRTVYWPPPMSLTDHNDVTHYGHFRSRFKVEEGHEIIIPKIERWAGAKARDFSGG